MYKKNIKMSTFILQEEFEKLGLEYIIKKQIPYVFVAQEYNQNFEKVLKSIKKACLEPKINVLSVANLSGQGSIWQEVLESIKHSDLGISDMSESEKGSYTNQNVTLETGMLLAQDKPVLFISTDVGKSIQRHTDLRDQRWIQYSLENLPEFEKEIQKHIFTEIKRKKIKAVKRILTKKIFKTQLSGKIIH